MNYLPHIASRMFNTPVLIHPRKAEVIVGALADRMGIARVARLMEDDDAPMLSFSDEGRNPRKGYDVEQGVALIPVAGTLVQKLGALRPMSGMTGYDGIRQNLFAALADDEVKAIVFDIDSPGGEAAGCFDLVDTIFEARGAKPITAIVDEMAFSAAYAIASACDEIMVPRTGGTGSVGVIVMHMDMSDALDAAGLKVTIITHGDLKADGNPYQRLARETKARIQADIDTMGELFVETVARNRNMAASKVRDMQAATFLGSAGVDRGLADAVMAPDAAFLAVLEKLA